jgi:hypothetical protein
MYVRSTYGNSKAASKFLNVKSTPVLNLYTYKYIYTIYVALEIVIEENWVYISPNYINELKFIHILE